MMSKLKQTTLVSLDDLVPADHIYRRYLSLWSFDGVRKKLKAIEKDNNYKGYGALRLFKCLLLQFIEDLSDFRQLSRALKALIDEGLLARISFGVYAKTEKSEYTGNTILKEPFDIVTKEALNKMGVKWILTEAQKAYNDRKSTQIPAKPEVRLKSRCRRVFAFQNAKLNYEENIYAR